MKNMKEILKALPGGKVKRLLDNSQERWLKVINHPAVRDFQQSHPDIPPEEYQIKLPKLSQFTKEFDQCKACQGLESCSNLVTGYTSQLVGYNGCIDLQLKKCRKIEAFEAMERRKKLFKSHQIPVDVLRANFENIDFDADRMDAIELLIDYSNQFTKATPRLGLYLYGSFGVGKSHMVAALANHLTGQGIDSYMVYLPDFVQNIYTSIKDKNTDTLVDSLKNVTVLILDDIGAENLNPWMRDEILGTILQYRISEQLPTIYTSNLSLNDLERHLSNTAKGGYEEIKGMRIMERIRHYVKPIYINGHNRRVGTI